MGLLVDRPLYRGIGKMENDRIRAIITGRVAKAAPAQAEIKQSACSPSFYFLWRNIPHVGPKFEFSGFMDDFGFLVPIDFKALAIHLQEEGSSK